MARPVAVLLRPGKTPSGKEVRGHLRRLVRRIRRHWPQTRITIRGDAHYGRPEVMEWCDENGVDFVFGLSGNGVLDRLVDETADDIRTRRALDQQPSHEGNWCQASIALRHGTCCRLIWSPRQPSLDLFLIHINNLPMWALWSCGRRISVVQAQRQIHRVCWPPTPPLARQCVLAALHADNPRGARHWAHLHAANGCTVKDRHLPRRRSVVESVARAHPLTAVLMPAEPHIRSPFIERLAPQSLILEVIGLGRVDPHCISAYCSHCLRRSTRPDPTRLIRPRGTRDN